MSMFPTPLEETFGRGGEEISEISLFPEAGEARSDLAKFGTFPILIG
jgi:hypothetical protein